MLSPLNLITGRGARTLFVSATWGWGVWETPCWLPCGPQSPRSPLESPSKSTRCKRAGSWEGQGFEGGNTSGKDQSFGQGHFCSPAGPWVPSRCALFQTGLRVPPSPLWAPSGAELLWCHVGLANAYDGQSSHSWVPLEALLGPWHPDREPTAGTGSPKRVCREAVLGALSPSQGRAGLSRPRCWPAALGQRLAPVASVSTCDGRPRARLTGSARPPRLEECGKSGMGAGPIL